LSASERSRVYERDLRRANRAELGDRDLVVGKHLEQQRLCLDLDAIDLVDEQDDRIGRPDRLEQRTGQQELLGEKVLFQRIPARTVPTWCVLGGTLELYTQQLLLVVPLIERLGLVQTLIALESYQPGPRDTCGGLRELGLAGPRRTLDKNRLGELVGQVDHAGQCLIGDVADLSKCLPQSIDGLEATLVLVDRRVHDLTWPCP
jgi:hypothetical protein